VCFDKVFLCFELFVNSFEKKYVFVSKNRKVFSEAFLLQAPSSCFLRFHMIILKPFFFSATC